MAQPGGDDPTFVITSAMAERFNERTGGEYEIKIFPAETLVKVPESLDAIRTGAVEMGILPWGQMSMFCPMKNGIGGK
jgi:TRAP-type C4-dicarboxylate transport system substrate-binding protein